LGLISNVGTAFSPVIGSEIVKAYSIDALFYTSSFFALIAGLLYLSLTETLKDKQPFQWQYLQLTKKDVFEPAVLSPTVVMFLMTAGFGAIFTIIPDLSVHLSISNKGFPLMFFTICSLSVRIFAGKVSDKFGRITILRYALGLQIIALILMGFANTPISLYICTSLFGFGMGFSSPTILAWAIDLSTETTRGRSLATVYLALEAGIGIGALLSAWIYDNDSNRFAYAFWAAAAFSFVGLIYVALLYKNQEMKSYKF
jgi:MFS family permease